MTQAATIEELHRAEPDASRLRLFARGMNIGRAHIGATVNTLFLAYAGAALPLMLLFTQTGQPASTVVTGELVATEPDGHVGFPGAGANDRARLHQRLAAAQVTVAVVHRLELVEIAVHHRDHAVAARVAGHGLPPEGADLGMLAVMVFMLVYYRGSGINADLALVLNLVILLGFMAYIGAVMTLPGIAGFILTIGMGVDSNVLIFERIREELAAHDRAHPERPAAPFAVNQIVHRSNQRLEHDLEVCVRHRVPIVITSLGTHMIRPASCWSVSGSIGITRRAST